MISAIDDLHRQIQLTNPAHRIVSLVPSITKTLIDLGLQDRLVGVTKFCDDPIEITKQIQKIKITNLTYKVLFLVLFNQ